jgi:hypothetical protein
MAEKTGAEAGLSGDEQIRIALQTMVERGGKATTNDIYASVNAAMVPDVLSGQGKSSLRELVNRRAVKAGWVLAHDAADPGWRITQEGRAFLEIYAADEAEAQAVQAAANVAVAPAPNVPPTEATNPDSVYVLAAEFERHVLAFMRQYFPFYSWYHQGRHKSNERGLDIIGTRLRPEPDHPAIIGVQVKYRKPDSAPTDAEWLKFMAGCFARRVQLGMFVTTGGLNANQRREAAEAGVVVIEREELDRLAAQIGLPSIAVALDESKSDV